ncbi:MAG: hypothetical protein U5L96_10750 [Owenweeksia sp.]|nr:hypothetical protein [Owenweeksia sp.]
MQDLPKQTARIFELLSKGYFINSNSNDTEQRELYANLETHAEPLRQYFQQIGFMLEQGDEYFYFSRQEEKTTIERKIDNAYKWIDILDFFKTFNNSFAPGFRFYTTQLVEEVRVNGLLRNKLNELNRNRDTSAREQIEYLLKQLEREGYIEKIDEFNDTWKVTAALHYLEQLILAIEIPEEEVEAKPENKEE